LIDLHCHILPGLDDGPENIDQSLEMVRRAGTDGIRTIVATPHTHNTVYRNHFDDVCRCVDTVGEIIRNKGLGTTICPGLEVRMCPGMVWRLGAGEIGTLNQTGRYLLVEFPFQALPSGYRNELFDLRLKGVTPIIAHPERNLVLQNELERVYELVEMGCLLQLTAMSITGELGEAAMVCARELLDLRLAHVIASDAHSHENRPPVLSSAVEAAARILGSETEARDMVTKTPAAIIEGRNVDVPEPMHVVKKGWFARLAKLVS